MIFGLAVVAIVVWNQRRRQGASIEEVPLGVEAHRGRRNPNRRLSRRRSAARARST